MKIVSNLVFKGECRQAFEYYAQVLGGEITAMFSFGDAPEDMQPGGDTKDMIMHAWLQIGDQALMGCDAPPQYQQEMSGFSVSYHSAEVAEAKRVFEALCEGGRATMPFAATFWSPGFGMLTDRFGTPWMVNTTPAEPVRP